MDYYTRLGFLFAIVGIILLARLVVFMVQVSWEGTACQVNCERFGAKHSYFWEVDPPCVCLRDGRAFVPTSSFEEEEMKP